MHRFGRVSCAPRRGSPVKGIPYESAQDRPNEQFVMIHNDRARNVGPDKLTGLAMALHHYLLSLPSGWTTTIDQIAEDVFPLDSRESLRRANRELMNAGYVALRTSRNGRGLFVKRYETFHTAQPVENRTPSKAVAERRRKSPQVAPDAGSPAAGYPAAGEPAAGYPAAGNPADIQKTDDEDCKKKTGGKKSRAARVSAPRREAMVSRQAHGSAASAPPKIRTDQQIIEDTRFAIASIYGESWNRTISDDEALALYRMKAPASKPVTSVVAYMSHIFESTPAFDTLLSQLDTETWAAEHLDDDGQPCPPCPRCGGMQAEIDPERGICAWCARELIIAGDRAEPASWNVSILDAVRTSLFVATGKTMDDAWCARVADHILTDDKGKPRDIRGGVAAKVRYITKTITEDTQPVRFLPTPVPGAVPYPAGSRNEKTAREALAGPEPEQTETPMRPHRNKRPAA